MQRYQSLSEKLKKAKEQRTEKEELLSAAEGQFSSLLSPYAGEIPQGREENILEEQIQWNRQAERLADDARLKRKTAEDYKLAHPFPDRLPTDLPRRKKRNSSKETPPLSAVSLPLWKNAWAKKTGMPNGRANAGHSLKT